MLVSMLVSDAEMPSDSDPVLCIGATICWSYFLSLTVPREGRRQREGHLSLTLSLIVSREGQR